MSAFAFVGPDGTIPTTNLVLGPVRPGWVLAGPATWTATITYSDHGRSDSQVISGTSSVWSPILIDFQGQVQGGTIHMNVSAKVRDIGTGAEDNLNWSGSSTILGQNPPPSAVKSRLGPLDCQIVAYKESSPKWCQFDATGLPSYGNDPTPPGGFGIMQLTVFPTPTARQIWDWTQNVDAGVAKYQAGKATINQHYANIASSSPGIQPLLPDQLKLAYYQYYNTGNKGFYWIPSTDGKSFVKNPNSAYTSYGDNAVAIEAQIGQGIFPAGW